MQWKTTVILLAAAVGIGTYISLYEIKQPTPSERKYLSKHVLDAASEAVTQLVLDLPQSKVTLTRDAGSWRLSPDGLRADPARVDVILSHLAPLQAERVLDEPKDHPLDLAAFGLEPAIGSISIVVEGTQTTLLLGETTALPGNRYVKVSGRPQVYVVSSGLFDAANLPRETFRDTQLIRVDSWLVEELAVTTSSLAFAVVRLGEAWRLTKPLEDRADTNEVRTALTSLSGISITRFVDDAPQIEQLSTWGFDRPKAEVSLRQPGDGSASVTLVFGNPLPDEPTLVYAKRSDEPPLYAVPAASVEALFKDPQALRAKACFEFFTSNVTKLEMAQGAAAWSIQKGDDGRWKVEQAGTELDTTKVEDLLKRLAELRLAAFVEETPSDLARYGLQAPSGALSVWIAGDATPQRLLVGGTLEGTGERYGRIDGRSPVVTLPAAATELLATALESLRASVEASGGPAPE